MDGAMWGALRVCSCLCPWREGVGLVTRENHHGGGGTKGRACLCEGEGPGTERSEPDPLSPGSPSTGKAEWQSPGAPGQLRRPLLHAGGWAVTQGGSGGVDVASPADAKKDQRLLFAKASRPSPHPGSRWTYQAQTGVHR